MNARTVALALASAVTTFLLVGAATIALSATQFGDSPGVGILGVFAGVLGGLLALVLVAAFGGRLSGAPVAALVGYGTFGVAFLGIAGLSYVNVPGADAVFTFPVHLGTSAVLAVVAAAAAFARRGRPLRTDPSV